MPLELGFELVLMHILIAKKKRDIKGARLYRSSTRERFSEPLALLYEIGTG